MNEQERQFTEMILKAICGDDFVKKSAIIDDKRTIYINIMNEEVEEEM